jgi:hypothetical protein
MASRAAELGFADVIVYFPRADGVCRARGDAGADRPLDDRGGSAQDVIGGPRAARSVPA